MSILISDKLIDFKQKMLTRYKEGHFILIKSIRKITQIIPIYGPNNRVPKMHEAKVDRIEGRNRQFNNNSWKLQYATFNNG